MFFFCRSFLLFGSPCSLISDGSLASIGVFLARVVCVKAGSDTALGRSASQASHRRTGGLEPHGTGDTFGGRAALPTLDELMLMIARPSSNGPKLTTPARHY